jgi:hypothetical protein
MVLIIPTFPLPPPERARAVMAQGKLVDRPQKMLVKIVMNMPVMTIGFRPKRSDAWPHRIAVQHWEKLNTALVIPAHFATFILSMPKLSIISG